MDAFAEQAASPPPIKPSDDDAGATSWLRIRKKGRADCAPMEPAGTGTGATRRRFAARAAAAARRATTVDASAPARAADDELMTRGGRLH